MSPCQKISFRYFLKVGVLLRSWDFFQFTYQVTPLGSQGPQEGHRTGIDNPSLRPKWRMFWPQFFWLDRDESNHISSLLLLGKLPNITPKQIYLILNQNRTGIGNPLYWRGLQLAFTPHHGVHCTYSFCCCSIREGDVNDVNCNWLFDLSLRLRS